MLVLTRKKKQSLMLGDDIEIHILEVRGDQVKIGIKAPDSLRILRQEIYADIKDQNTAAAASQPGLPVWPGKTENQPNDI